MQSVAGFSQEGSGLLDGAGAAAVTLGLHLDEGLDQVPVVHPKQVGEGRLLDLQEGLLDNLDAPCACTLVLQLEVRELGAHSSLHHAPDRLDRLLQLAAVGGDELDLGELLHDAQPVLTLVGS